MLFISSYQLFSFLRYLKLRPDFFGHVGKRLGKKAEINSKIYDVTNWETNNCNSWFPCLIFCMIFKEKYFSCYVLLTNFNYSNFIVWLFFLHEILGHICIIIICFSVCDVINFEIKLSYQRMFFFFIRHCFLWKEQFPLKRTTFSKRNGVYLKEIFFNYCIQWPSEDDQKIDCSIISMGAMSYNI